MPSSTKRSIKLSAILFKIEFLGYNQPPKIFEESPSSCDCLKSQNVDLSVIKNVFDKDRFCWAFKRVQKNEISEMN